MWLGMPPEMGTGADSTGTSCMDVTVAGFDLKSAGTRFTLAISSARVACDGGSVVKSAGSGRGF